ncbi:MAG: type II toxin-antitoxin system VapC family toxin [Streptosporangiaceae bacterium]
MRFADTSFWYAVQERRDRHHTDAAALARDQRSKVITSNHVVGETWTLLRRRAGHHAAVGFLDRLAQLPNVEVTHVDEDLEADAWRWLRGHADREYSFVDATSFALMRRRRIREALAFDGDFAAAGFVEVRPG